MNSHQAQLEVGARSETGYVRDENQDRMSGTRVPLGQLYVVADGMGGHKGGAVAAELTVQGLQQYIGEAPANASVEEVMQTAFTKTNAAVYQKAHAGDPATEGMGSTAVLLLITGQIARVGHVGDSRAYIYRKGRLQQLTTDHTIVQKMVQAGMLQPQEAADHPNASVLDRAIGSKPEVEVDISEPLQLHEGDAILLCSDGLCGYVTDAEIASVLRSQATVQEIPEHLVQLTLQKGGMDNVTVQFVQYGTRKETRLIAPLLLHPLFRIAVAFVLGAVLAIAVFSLFALKKANNPQETAARLTTDLENKKAELGDANRRLLQVQSDLNSMTVKAEGLSRQLEETQAKGKGDRKGLEEELKKAQIDRDSFKKQSEKSQEQLKRTEEELKKVKKNLEITEGQLKTTKENLESIKDRVNRLKLEGTPESQEPR
jgi:PPM family protein phosphatase